VLKAASSSTESKDVCLIFYGTMLASALSFALLEWGTLHNVNFQQSLLNWLQSQRVQKDWAGGDLPADLGDLYGQSTDIQRPLGYIQLVLACIPAQPPSMRKRLRKLAAHNQALAFLDKDMLVCIMQDQWAEYRDRIAKSCGVVLSKVLENQETLLNKLIRTDSRFAETPYPSDRYQMLIRFLSAAGKVYTMTVGAGGNSSFGGVGATLMMGASRGGGGGGGSSFDSALQRAFDNIRKQLFKIISAMDSNSVYYLYAIYSAWYELLQSTLYVPHDSSAALNSLSLDILLAQLNDADVIFEKANPGVDSDLGHPDMLAHLHTYSDLLRNFVNLPEWTNSHVMSIAHAAGNQNMRKYCVNDDRRRKLGAQGTSQGDALVKANIYMAQDKDRVSDACLKLEADMIRYHRSWLMLLQAVAHSVNSFLRSGMLGLDRLDSSYDRLHKLCQVSLRLCEADGGYEKLTPAWLLSDGGGIGYRSTRTLDFLGDLWLSVLPASIKAEIVKEIDQLADYVIAAETAGRQQQGIGVENSDVAVQQLERIWREFVCERVMMRGVVEVPQRVEQVELRGDVYPFHCEFMLIDRDLGRYNHTLALLTLLDTIFKRHVPYSLEDNRVGEVIYNCIMLLPPAEGEQGLFITASDRWKLYSGVLRMVETVMLTLFEKMRSGPEDWRKHPACALFEQVLEWVVLPEGQTHVSLRSNIMDMLVLGLQIAEESEDEGEKPNLAAALEVALRVVHLAVFVCNTVEEYRHGCMLEAIIAERGRVRPGGKRLRTLLVSIMWVGTLHDEPKLAWRALQLMQLICQKRDQDVMQVLVSDMSEATREDVIMAFAEWLQQAESKHEVTRSIFDLILDSLARVDDEHSTAHFLLGFTPYHPALSELSKACPTTRLIQVLYDMCGEEGRWLANWETLYKVRLEMEKAEEDCVGGGRGNASSDGVPDERQLMLLHLSRNEHCVEIFYRLVAHAGTREATLRLLLDSHAFVGWGRAGGGGGGGEGSKGRLLGMMEALPIDFAMQQGATVKQLRQWIKVSWAGEEEAGLRPHDKELYWEGGKRDLPVEEAAEQWMRRQEEMEQPHMYKGRLISIDEAIESIDRCKTLRFDIHDLEDQLDDAQECLINFFHQTGWFLRTVAILLFSTREQLSGVGGRRGTRTTGNGEWRQINFSLEHAQQLFKTLFGSPESAGGGGGGGDHYPAVEVGEGDGGGHPIWSRGKLHALLLLGIDLSDEEMESSDLIHEMLSESDLEDCKTPVDRWSEGTLWMVDEKKLQLLLEKKLLYSRLSLGDPAAHQRADSCIHRRVLGSYDGFNTVRRCRSAREHLMCGLQDVLEQVLTPVGASGKPLLAHVLRLDHGPLNFFLFDLLALLRRSEDLFAQPHVAGHLARCISLVLSAIASPTIMRAGVIVETTDESARQCLLKDLDFLLSVPAQTVATSGISLRADLYSAILKLLQYLQRRRAREGDVVRGRAGGALLGSGAEVPADVEEVLARHRTELFRVAVLDMSSLPEGKASAAERRVECESKAVALAVIQVLLPQPGGIRDDGWGMEGQSLATLKGLLVHHNLVMHLTDYMLPGDEGSQLGEVLDVTKTEDKQPQLLIFTAKMAVLLQLAQVSFSFFGP
jgi:hypothetical protein